MEIQERKAYPRGGKELKKYLSGERLTRHQALLANCFECCGGYIDGKYDCGIQSCACHPFMPYRGKRGAIPVASLDI